MKVKKISKVFIMTLALVLVMGAGFFATSKAATRSVSSVADLKSAIAAGDDINITSSFTIDEVISVPSSYTGNIEGNGNTLSAGNIPDMFMVDGANITFKNIILDGAQKSRLIKSYNKDSQVRMMNSTIQNGASGVIPAYNYSAQGASVYLRGGVFTLDNSTIKDSLASTLTKKTGASLEDALWTVYSSKTENAGHLKTGPEYRAYIDKIAGESDTPQGGAIYADINSNKGAIVNIINNSKVINNSFDTSQGNPYADGGAIYAAGNGTIINVDNSEFKGNHCMTASPNNTGGAIYARAGALVKSNNADFHTGNGFNTGGSIRLFEARGEIENTRFHVKGLPDGCGISGGAICSEGSTLLVNNSQFEADGASKVTFAGGFIDIVGGGKFHLTNSTLTGKGKGNGKELASYGGAICFETGSHADALIENVTITGMSASNTGGAIAVGTKKEDNNTAGQSVTILNTNISDTQTLWWGRQAGGGIFVSKGNSVLLDKKSVIHSSNAGVGGSIYNRGSVTITGGTKLTDGYAMYGAAGIYNDGKLLLDDMSLSANFTGDAWWNGGYTKYKNPQEFPGINIYAKKDIIVTPNAKISDKDIKVFDKQSSVILAGAPTGKLNVSISENDGTNNTDEELFEPMHRYVGYTVARGAKVADFSGFVTAYDPNGAGVKYIPDSVARNYEATKEDAQKFNYVTKDGSQPVADYTDHTSTAKWDYLLNPDEKSVVLGQRAAMVYHSNEASATFEAGAGATADTDPNGQKITQIYEFYMSGGGKAPKATPSEMTKVDATPSLNNFSFKGWYDKDAKDHPKYNEETNRSIYKEYKFPKFTDTWIGPNTVAEITSIMNVASSNTLHTYGVYDKMYTVKAKKVWSKTQDKDTVTFALMKGDEEIQTKTVTKEQEDTWITFDGVPKVDDQGNDISSKYKVIEKGQANGKITLANDKTYKVSVEDVTGINGNTDRDTKYFAITNEQVQSIQVEKTWSDDTPQGKKVPVTLQLTKDGVDVAGKSAVVNPSNSWKKTFEDLPVLNDDGSVAKYSVREVGTAVAGSNDKITIGSDVYKFEVSENGNKRVIKNTYQAPPTVTFKAKKTWVGGSSEKPEITLTLQQNGRDYTGAGAKRTLTNGNLEATWDNLPQNDSNGTAFKYTVKEDSVANYTTEYKHTSSQTEIINTYVAPKRTFTATKKWDDNGAGTSETVVRPTVTFVLKQNGATYTGAEAEKTLSNGTTKVTWSNLPETDNNGVAYKYTVEEKPVPNYTTSYNSTGDVVTNTYTPGKTTFTATKVWENGPIVKPDVTFVLQQNGADYKGSGAEKVLRNGTNTVTWDNLPVADRSGNNYTYTVKEKPVAGYTTSYDENKTTVTNTFIIEKIDFTAYKTWVDGPTVKPNINFVLQQNGADYQGDGVIKNLENGVSQVTWKDLPKTDKQGNPYVYTVKEEPVQGYETSYNDKKDRVTNTYIVGTTKFTATKLWENGPGIKPEITLVLQQNGKDYQGEDAKKVIVDGQNVAEWNDLPATDKQGNEYKYSVREEGEKDGIVTLGKHDYKVKNDLRDKEATITNIFVEKETSFTVKKVWVGGPKEKPEITLVLKQNGEIYQGGEAEKTLKNGEETATWSNLPLTDKEGNEYKYTVEEKAVEGYKTSYNDDTTVITNTYIEKPKIEDPNKPADKPEAKNKKPSKKMPKTGDDSGIELGYLGAILSGVMGLAVATRRKNKR